MTSSIDVVITRRASRNVDEILLYTEKTWGSGQKEVYRELLEQAFRRIGTFPDIGHPVEGRPSNIREYVLPYHVIQYRREPELVVILRVVNPRRRR